MDIGGIRMSKRNECENIVKRMLEAVLDYQTDSMKVNVYIGLCGEKEFVINKSRQTTLHEYGDIGIEPNEDEMLHQLNITLNKKLIHHPELGDVVKKILDKVEEAAYDLKYSKR